MRKIALILLTIITLSSCGSTKNKRVVTRKSKTTKTIKKTPKHTNASSIAVPKIAQSIINNAERYEGTRYKYGGTTKKGMDCSGLIYTAFKEDNVTIPRVSSAMAKAGDWIDLKTVREGDLLFFATKKNNRKVNHVGLVTAINGKDVEFIHSTTSKGVITSKLKEKYWYFAFVQARRVL
ncbi:C40 family peptidase [Lacinutrix sp. Bg11-31]|uniref:C40 family peptidase n=1 Tax=Lacinutrix sp. Bg11-31 TaxID=2057808 RepID=UPI000C31B61C|nr:C40 family peptidase [Lacinutrix sp. Bg11-31]AUC82438.1 NlpC/P60 family protein [Lacinutrix sp. Bg11-31]